MKNTYFLRASILSALVGPSLVTAQEQAAQVPAQVQASTPSSAGAVEPQKSASTAPVVDNGQLTTVIVTAQRRAQRAQDVPISISVVGEAQLRENGFKGLDSIERLVPSVQYDPANGGGFQIRGIGTQAFDLSTEQAVSVVVDDVVQDLPRNIGINGLTDIERVEVLRGPQGVQFGKNASAGVISVVTKKPTLNEFSGRGAVEFGQRNDRKVNASVNVPLGAKAALGVGAYTQGQDGSYRYVVLNKSGGDFRQHGIRAKLLIEPTTDLELLLTVDLNKHKDNAPPPSGGALVFAAPPFDQYVAAAGVRIGPRNLGIATDLEPLLTYDNNGLALAANYRIGEHTLTSVTAKRKLTMDSDVPVNVDPVSQVAPFNILLMSANKFSEEIRLTSPSGKPFTYVLGLFYNRLESQAANEQAGTFGQPLPPGTYLSISNGITVNDNKIESKAAFATGSYKFSDTVELVAGARLTHDKNEAAVTYRPVTAYNAIPISNFVKDPAQVSAKNFSYRLSPTVHLDRNTMVFATFSTGYKGPGAAYSSALGLVPYQEEKVKNLELGIKTELLNRRLRLNATAFNTRFVDFQAQTVVFNQGVPAFVVGNAGGLRSRGIETDVTFRATRMLTINGALTYADSVFTDYLKGGVQYAGNALTNAPKWSGSLGARLNVPVTDKLLMNASASYSYRTKTYMQIADPEAVQEGYGLLQARVAFGPQDGSWQAGFYGRNLTNQFYNTNYINFFGGALKFRGASNDVGRTLGVFASADF